METVKYYYTRPIKLYTGLVIGGECIPARKAKQGKKRLN